MFLEVVEKKNGGNYNMAQLKVSEYGLRNRDAELKFTDNSHLLLVPYRHYGGIEGFDSALLYKSRVLEALATDRPTRYSMPEDSGFWSAGNIFQPQLAEYLTVAAQVAQQVYKDHEAKKITQDLWSNRFQEFWLITKEMNPLKELLKREKVRIFGEKPKRFDSTLF